MIEALTLTPPWDFMVIHAGKNPENRKWKTSKRGWILIHAAVSAPPDDYNAAIAMAETAGYTGPLPAFKEMKRGVIVGAVRITNCLHYDEQKRCGMPLAWSIPAQFGFMVADPIALPPVPARGMQQFWKVPRDVREKLLAECDRAGTPLPPELRKMLADADANEPVKAKKQMGLFGE